MTVEQAKHAIIAYWLGSADEALQSARSEAKAGRGRFAVNRAYYACFYAASALLLNEDRKFVKHTGLRNAVHRDLVHPGRIEAVHGETYDRLYDSRTQADYGEIVHFSDRQVQTDIEDAERFVITMKTLLGK